MNLNIANEPWLDFVPVDWIVTRIRTVAQGHTMLAQAPRAKAIRLARVKSHAHEE